MKKILTGGMLVGTAYLLYRAISQPAGSNKKIKKVKHEKELPTYDFSDASKLNKYERKFKKYLKSVKKELPKNKKVIVKKREPVLLPNGMIEQAYIVDRPDGITYIVTPEIRDTETLSFAVHEGCHLRDGHQDPNDKDYQLSPFEKELEVEKCVRDFFRKHKIINNYKRSRREIRRAYT